mmetsp:Transcript_28522/g.80466  ORF Transcript_28522/g.80466 Transcript_28522/m.80466 type:complete len:239 (+) Transcript_28522:979-1695(+)
MGVSMEEPKLENLQEVGLDVPAGELLHVHAGLGELLLPIDLHTRHILEGEHLGRAVVPEDLGHLDPRGVLEVLAEAVGVGALLGVVDLLEENTLALVVDGHPVSSGTVGFGVNLLQPLRQDTDVLAVDLKQLLQPGPLHLHNHSLPLELREVHLAEGGGGDGLLLKLVKDLVDGGAEALLHGGACGLPVKGRHCVLQLLQLLHKLGRQHVHPRGELLPDLDEGGAQLDQLLPQPHRQF